jgi:hypothetical protein
MECVGEPPFDDESAPEVRWSSHSHRLVSISLPLCTIIIYHFPNKCLHKPCCVSLTLECRASSRNVRNSSLVKPHSLEDDSSFGPSAAFIRHEVDLDADYDVQERVHTGRDKKQSFDLLPKSAKGNANLADNNRLPRNASPPPVIITIADNISTPSLQTENTAPSINLTSAIARHQYKWKRTYAPPLFTYFFSPIAQFVDAISDAEL